MSKDDKERCCHIDIHITSQGDVNISGQSSRAALSRAIPAVPALAMAARSARRRRWVAAAGTSPA